MKCYECIHHRCHVGDAHLRCANPASASELGIQINDYGAQNGWAYWPVNFDPIWIEKCNGFKKTKQNQKG